MVKKLTNYERDRSKDFQPYFELIYQHPSNVEKIQRYVSSRTGCIPIWPYFIKEVNQEKDLTDIQKISNYLELVYKHTRNVSKRFQKDISSRTKDIKQFSQLTTDGGMHGRTDTRT